MRSVTVQKEGAVSDAGSNAPYQTPWHWLLVRDKVSGLEVLTQRTPKGEVIVPVFSAEEEASAYLSDRRGASWKPRKTGRGELVSVLMGVCRDARWVVLDPPPSLTAEEALKFLGMSRESLLEPLVGRGRSWFEEERKRQRCGQKTGDRYSPIHPEN